MAELDLTQGKLDAVMTDPVTGRHNDIFSALLEREKQVRDSRTLGQRAADRFYIEDAEGNPVPKYSESMVEEDPRVQELRQMRREFKREQDKANSWFEGDRIIDLLRGAGDAVFGSEIMDNLPMLLRAMQNTNKDTLTTEQMREMSRPLDESSFSMRLSKAPGLEEQVESGLSYAGVSPEAAGLGALAAGAMKGRGKGLFDMLGDALDPSTIRKYDDKEFKDFQKGVDDVDNQLSGKTVGKGEFAELDAMIERGLKPKGEGIPDAPYRGPSTRFAELSNEGKKKMQDLLNKRNRLRGELMEDDYIGAERERDLQRQIEVLEDQLRPFFPIDRMAKGGRPGTRRRKKIMVPASYKAGGQVFQKGYYGKTYK